MYKPPQNSNRVKSIKSKFENLENNKSPEKKTVGNIKNGTRNNLNNGLPSGKNNESRQPLSRQLSDPSKRNIKRTPAFRCDKNVVDVETTNNGFVRNNICNRSTHFESKIKQFNSAVKNNNCDNNSNFISSSNNNVNNCTDNVKTEVKTKNIPVTTNNVPCSSNITRPALIKSKSSHDFAYIRSKFNNQTLNSNINNLVPENQRDEKKIEDVDLSLLYTEPIPKSLRNKNGDNDTHDLEINVTKVDDIYTCSTLKLSKEKRNSSTEDILIAGLTDTLKTALKRPLPSGPAPQKPPRTFQHSATCNDLLKKNESFLHFSKMLDSKLNNPEINGNKTIPKKKADPKYMLKKLENALRNNKLKTRRQIKTELSTTSGEDSDDSLLFKSKSRSDRVLPDIPLSDDEKPCSTFFDNTLPDSPPSNFNCLNGLVCANSPYERIKEPNSSFFVSCSEEPVYAEPFHHQSDKNSVGVMEDVKKRVSNGNSKDTSLRNSLYYMSSPVLNGEETVNGDSVMGNSPPSKQNLDLPITPALYRIVNRQASAENSSLSSFTSDLETPSPLEESPNKIKHIIETFEKKPNNEQLYDSNVRVQNLKSSLQETLNNSFDCDERRKEENGERVLDLVAKFQTYIKTLPKYACPCVNKDTLFYCCMIIERVQDTHRIKYKFPPNVEVPNIESLCFPENELDLLHSPHDATQSYSLTITNDKGERTFGYCRRVLPEGSTRCLPLAYCILSKYRANRFYKKILMELESRHGCSNRFRDELIKAFYRNKFPKPGESIKIDISKIDSLINKTDNKENVSNKEACRDLEESLDLRAYVNVHSSIGEYGTINNRSSKKSKENIYISEHDVKESCISPSFIVENGEKIELVLTLHPDSRYEDTYVDIKTLHSRLPNEILLKIFSSLLLERKVILISSQISILSSCVDALQSILYPFSWPHTFIPILPQALWDLVETPTPIICGVLSADVVEYHTIENGMVVNLDDRTVVRCEGDEDKIISGSMQKIWKKCLQVASKAATAKDYVHSLYLADSYLQVFILCFKNYKNYIVDGDFQVDLFVKNGKTKGIRRFLNIFTQTCMFMAFKDAILSDPNCYTAFDRKIETYGADDPNMLLDKLLGWN